MTPNSIKELMAGLSPEEKEHLVSDMLEILSPIEDLDALTRPDFVPESKAELQKLIVIAQRLTAVQQAWSLSLAIGKDPVFVKQMADADARWDTGDRATISVDEFRGLISY